MVTEQTPPSIERIVVTSGNSIDNIVVQVMKNKVMAKFLQGNELL